MPVKLPPGRAQLSASFASTGSPLKPNTTGFAAFACSMPIAMNSCVTSPEGAEFQVAAFDPAELAQARAQRFKIRRRLVRLPHAQPCNVSDLVRLGPGRKWQGCKRIRNLRAAEQRDDIATPHHPNSKGQASRRRRRNRRIVLL